MSLADLACRWGKESWPIASCRLQLRGKIARLSVELQNWESKVVLLSFSLDRRSCCLGRHWLMIAISCIVWYLDCRDKEVSVLIGALSFIHYNFHNTIFTARQHSLRCIVLAIVNPSVCPSVRLSDAGTVSKRLQLRSCGLHWRIAPWL